MSVVVSHGWNLVPPAGRKLIEGYLVLPAYFGVELFFVLSGFLIGSILLKEKHTSSFTALRKFWIRRWFRTLPNYYLVILLTLLADIVLGHTEELHRRDLLDLLFLQNFAWAHSRFYGISWSLAVEEWFYLLFPLGVLLLRKWKFPFGIAFVGVTVLFILGPTLARIVASQIRPDLFFDAHYWKIVVFRLDAVMYGVLAAWLKQVFPQGWSAQHFGLLFLSFLILCGVTTCFVLGRQLPAIVFNILICPLTSLGFALSLPFFDRLDRKPFGPFAGLIGRVALYSYSIYLIHPIICDGLEYLTVKYTPGFAICYALVGVLVILSYLVSKALFHLYEKPMMDLRERYSHG